MAQWVSQDDVSTDVAGNRTRVAWLSPVEPAIRDALERYLVANPRGEEATLVAFAAIGRERLFELAVGARRSQPQINQDVGMLVPLMLADRYGPGSVLTWRDGRTSRTRPVPREHTVFGWVKTFTPHCISR